MENRKTKWIIGILILLVLILGMIVVYTYVAKPVITGYVTKTYNQGASQGANDVLSVLINQIQTQGYVQIPVGNQTLVLIPYIPPQLSQENPENNSQV